MNVDGVSSEVQPNELKPNAKLKVRLTLPEGTTPDGLRILHIHEDGKIEEIEEIAIGKGLYRDRRGLLAARDIACPPDSILHVQQVDHQRGQARPRDRPIGQIRAGSCDDAFLPEGIPPGEGRVQEETKNR